MGLFDPLDPGVIPGAGGTTSYKLHKIAVREPNHRLKTPGGIGYSLVSGPTLNSPLNGPLTAQAEYKVPVNKLLAFLNEVQPTPTRSNGVVFLAPAIALNLPAMFVPTTVQVDGFNTDRPLDPYVTDATNPSPLSGVNVRDRDAYGTPHGSYEPDCRVVINYSTGIDGMTLRTDNLAKLPRNSKDPITFLEPSCEVNAEALSINSNRLLALGENANDAKPLDGIMAPITKITPLRQLSFTWSWALYPDFKAIAGELGKLNPPDCDWLNNAEAETVMFVGLSGKMDFRHSNFKRPLPVWILNYKFLQRRIVDLAGGNPFIKGWNYVFDTGTMTYRRLRVNGLPLYGQTAAGLGNKWNNLFKCELTFAEQAAANAVAGGGGP